MEDLESFLGFAIPRLTWPQAKTHGTQTGQEGQNSAASEQIQAANDTSESPPHGCEVYYCPGVDDHEVDTSKYNHIDETLSTNSQNNQNQDTNKISNKIQTRHQIHKKQQST